MSTNWGKVQFITVDEQFIDSLIIGLIIFSLIGLLKSQNASNELEIVSIYNNLKVYTNQLVDICKSHVNSTDMIALLLIYASHKDLVFEQSTGTKRMPYTEPEIGVRVDEIYKTSTKPKDYIMILPL